MHPYYLISILIKTHQNTGRFREYDQPPVKLCIHLKKKLSPDFTVSKKRTVTVFCLSV